MLINILLLVGLIYFGYGIHVVKLGSSLIYITRPIAINFYVKRKYNLVKDVEPDNMAISQRWDGLGHHISYLLHNNTDVTLITIFSTVAEVSVYSVYYMVVQSIRKIVNI